MYNPAARAVLRQWRAVIGCYVMGCFRIDDWLHTFKCLFLYMLPSTPLWSSEGISKNSGWHVPKCLFLPDPGGYHNRFESRLCIRVIIAEIIACIPICLEKTCTSGFKGCTYQVCVTDYKTRRKLGHLPVFRIGLTYTVTNHDTAIQHEILWLAHIGAYRQWSEAATDTFHHT